MPALDPAGLSSTMKYSKLRVSFNKKIGVINIFSFKWGPLVQTRFAVTAYITNLPLPTFGAAASYDLILYEVSKSSNSARMAQLFWVG